MNPSILVVDDSPENVLLLRYMLAPRYTVRTAQSGEEALAALADAAKPDLMLLDVMMPGIDGYEVVRRMKKDPALSDIPVVFVTSLDDPADEELGLSLGAVDYVTKPVKRASLLTRVRTQLDIDAQRRALTQRIASLDAEIGRHKQENDLLLGLSGNIIGNLSEAATPGTSKHIKRVQRYVAAMCTDLAARPRFAAELTARNIEHIVKATPLYDIGMLLIPGLILRKRDPLTPQDWEIIRSHCQRGCDAIAQTLAGSAQHLLFLDYARDGAYTHHERWDGSGYPRTLAEEEIPLIGRLVALADTFDALIAKVPYRQAFDIIFQGRGTLFDPDIVDAFLTQFDANQTVAERSAETV